MLLKYQMLRKYHNILVVVGAVYLLSSCVGAVKPPQMRPKQQRQSNRASLPEAERVSMLRKLQAQIKQSQLHQVQ